MIMIKRYTKCICLVGVVGLAFFFTGCESQSEPSKPQVVRKKIMAKAPSAGRTGTVKKTRPAQKAKAARARTGLRPKSAISKTPKSMVAVASKQTAAPAKPKARSKVSGKGPKPLVFKPKSDVSKTPRDMTAKKDIAAKSKTPRPPPATVSKPKTAAKTKALKTPQATAKAKRKAPKDKTVAASIKTGVSSTSGKKPAPYNPAGKLDPFEPLFKEQPVVAKAKRVLKKRTPRTPLEKISISQLKLVGIVLAPSGNKALVQEASGKGYIIEKGTYIGLNSGRVVDIQRDNVIIEEEVADVLGKVMTRKKEIRLPKPPGE